MNDVVYKLLVMKRSFKTEKNERKTSFWLEITWFEITDTRNVLQCFLAVSGDFFSLEELVIRLQMAFPACVLEESTSIQHVHETYETCMNVSRIEQDVLKDCAERYKNLI